MEWKSKVCPSYYSVNLTRHLIIPTPHTLLRSYKHKKLVWPRISKFVFYDLYECSPRKDTPNTQRDRWCGPFRTDNSEIWGFRRFFAILVVLWGITSRGQNSKTSDSDIQQSWLACVGFSEFSNHLNYKKNFKTMNFKNLKFNQNLKLKHNTDSVEMKSFPLT